jgi:glucoamylase
VRIREVGFIVADDKDFWFGAKRLEGYRLRNAAPSIPVVRIVHDHPRFSLCLRVARDTSTQVLQIEVCLSGDEQLKVYALGDLSAIVITPSVVVATTKKSRSSIGNAR